MFSKKKALLIFVILLSLCLCISGISAEDSNVDIVSQNVHSANDDSIQTNVEDSQDLQASVDDNVVDDNLGADNVVEDAKVKEVEKDKGDYNVTPETFFNYFDEQGKLKGESVLPNGSSLNFYGTFENLGSVKTITIDRPVFFVGGNDSQIKNIGFLVTSSGVVLNGLNLDYTGAVDSSSVLIEASHADDLIIKDNNIKFIGQGGVGFYNFAVWVSYSNNVLFQNNILDVTVPSVNKKWEDPRIQNKDGAIFALQCDNIFINSNKINLTGSDAYEDYDTIQVITVMDSVNATVQYSQINAKGRKYIYGIFVSGSSYYNESSGEYDNYPAENYLVCNNFVNVIGEYYANGIDIDNFATGIVDENKIFVEAVDVVYGIYTNTFSGYSENNITNNYVSALANSVYCIELLSTKEKVISNILKGEGNFTIGIGSAADPQGLDIINNYIYCNGTGIGTPTGGDLSIASSNTAIVTTKNPLNISQNYIYTRSGEYSIDLENTVGSVIQYNALIAGDKTGERTINATEGNNITNNTILENIEITSENIATYIDLETGEFYNYIPDGAKVTFVGTFSGLNINALTINKKLNITGTNAIFKNIAIFVKASDVNITSITINIDDEKFNKVYALYVGAEDVVIKNSIINFTSAADNMAMAVYAEGASNFNFINNMVYFYGKGNFDAQNYALQLVYANDSLISSNNFTIFLPSADIFYSPTWEAVLRDGGIVIQNSGSVVVDNNNINLIAYDNFSYTGYDTVYVVNVENSDNFNFTNNKIDATGKTLIYGLVISGDNFLIEKNIFDITGEYYANGLNLARSSGFVQRNNISARANGVAYPIYSNDWTGGSINVSYLNNNITGHANSVYGMELTGTNEIVSDNNIYLTGNFTTGIGTYGTHKQLNIFNNNITCLGTGSGKPTGGDSYIPSTNVGIIVIASSANIANNNINTTGIYAINLTNTTDNTVDHNTLYAKDYAGGAAIYVYDFDAQTEIYANEPLMDASLTIIVSNSTLPGDNLVITVNGSTKGVKIQSGQMEIIVKSGAKTVYTAQVSVLDGKAIAVIPAISVGEYNITATFTSPFYNTVTAEEILNITDHYKITADNVNTYYKAGTYLVATLYKNNHVYAGQTVSFNIAGKIVTAKTDSKGQAKVLVTDLVPKTYKVSISSEGVKASATVKIAKSPVKYTSVTKTVKKGKYFQLKVLTPKNKAVSKQTVIIKIGNKKFTAKTSATGVAKVKVNLAPKKYKVTYQLKNNKYYASTSKSSTLTVKK